MRDLDKALIDIRTMRSQIARGTEFRGYGPMTVALTGLLAMAAAWLQSQWIETPVQAADDYLGLWIATAALSVVIIGIEVVTRARRIHSELAEEMILTAIWQLLPAMAAGVLLTFVMLQYAPESLWQLPGLWQIILSLGVFASCRSLPAPLVFCALWYLATGLACLAWAQNEHAMSPWAMGAPFGIGQLLAAALLQIVGAGDEEAA